jgi:drug/metabolite transporter (DMT)-like permease
MLSQRYMSSARAALLFCFETLFAAACSWMVMGERLSAGQWLGGGLILGGMVLAELPTAHSQPSAISGQPSAKSRQPSAIRRQLPTDRKVDVQGPHGDITGPS